MKFEIKARYEGFKMANAVKLPDIEEIDNRLWDLFFKDKSIQNRVLKGG